MASKTRTIRVATMADLPALDALLARSYPRLLAPDYPPSLLVNALPMITRANPALLQSGSYFIATLQDDTLVAAGGWTRARPGQDGAASKGRTGHIRHVVGHPDHLRQGHALAVLDTAMAQARHDGISDLECLSTRTAVPFYQAVGFARVRDVMVPVGAAGLPFPSVLMKRRL